MLSVCGLISASAQTAAKIEAESAAYENCKLVEDGKYSGGKALELTEANAKITFTYTAAESGKYTITVGYDGLYGDKVVNLSVNGNAATFNTTEKGPGEAVVGPYLMNKGDNMIEITPNWTWFRIDYVTVAHSESAVQFDIAQTPVDAKASDAAKNVYAFLYDNFGKKTISGIMTGDMETANGDVTKHADVQAVWLASGKYPALVGFDFMNATGINEADAWFKDYTDKSIALAKDLYSRGGLPAFTWHWRDPSRKTGEFYVTVDGKPACTMKISDAKIITKINHLNFKSVVASLELGSIIYPRYICAEAIVAYVRAKKESRNSNIETLYHLADHRVEALEFEVTEDSPVTGTPLFRLNKKDNLLIACINRDGHIIIPSGQDTIEVGDEVTVVTTHSGFRDLQDILAYGINSFCLRSFCS